MHCQIHTVLHKIMLNRENIIFKLPKNIFLINYLKIILFFS